MNGIVGFLDGVQIYQAVILIAGLVFLIIEMFSPGFGVSGAIGLVLLVLGIFITASSPFEALVMFIILLAILGVALTVILHSARRGRLSKTLILNESLKKESGYSSTEDLQCFVGKEGIAQTVLRPAGTAEFDGIKLDVVTEGEYIKENTKVKVIQALGRRIVVKAIE